MKNGIVLLFTLGTEFCVYFVYNFQFYIYYIGLHHLVQLPAARVTFQGVGR